MMSTTMIMTVLTMMMTTIMIMTVLSMTITTMMIMSFVYDYDDSMMMTTMTIMSDVYNDDENNGDNDADYETIKQLLNTYSSFTKENTY